MRKDFFLAMNIPSVTHQEKKIAVRNGKPVVYEDQRLKDARAKFTAYLKAHIPEAPMQGPVFLKTMWLYPDTKEHPPGTYKTTKPDTDNLLKLFKDCMTAVGFWKDDAQVCCEYTVKMYNSLPGIYVEISDEFEEGGPANAGESRRCGTGGTAD